MDLAFRVTSGSVSAQGSPRTGHRKHGVPPGGVFDQASSRLANLLVGNEPSHMSLELASASLQMVFPRATCFSLAGGGHEALLDGASLGVGIRATAEAGSQLTVRPGGPGFRSYLSLPGLRVLCGGEIRCDERTGRSIRLSGAPEPTSPVIRTVGDHVPSGQVSIHLDRMGVRVHTNVGRGPDQLAESRPVVFGAVQQSPDGNLLIHGPDGPTIGGYSVLGVVARVDADRIAQLAPGDLVEFRAISREDAREAFDRLVLERSHFESRLRLLAELR